VLSGWCDHGALHPHALLLIDEAAARTRLSLEFANVPSASSRLALAEYGVTHFVVDTTLTDNNSWAPWAEEIYRNDRFIVLQLE
jgi:hypothetical protein